MKSILIYSAPSECGASAQIAVELNTLFDFYFTPYNIIGGSDASKIEEYELVIFLVATYGDQELHEKFEDFITSIDFDLTGKNFVICELGNYYGYEDYRFGSADILRAELTKRNATELCNGLSMDTLPQLDWRALKNWAPLINNNIVV